MRRTMALWLAMLLVSGMPVSEAVTPIPVSTLTIKGVYGTNPHDSTIYCLLGSGDCDVVADAGAADAFIAKWLAKHPTAVAIPISDELPRPLMRGMATSREVFVWVEDHQESLTLSLVSQGFYPAEAFKDMFEQYQSFQQHLSALGGAPPPADAPEYRPHRLVSDADYLDRSHRVAAAEADAKRRSVGIWAERIPHANDARVAAEKSRQVFPAAELYVRGIQAHRIGDPDSYCLLGGIACEGHWRMSSLALGEAEFVERWLARHPNARAIPISGQNYKEFLARPMMHSTYIWVEDRHESLNIDLVRNGFYRANVLEDMVSDDPQNNTQLGAAGEELRKERAETGPPMRFITAEDYAARTARAALAEHEAEREKRGMWSDARLPFWKPPSDEQLIAKYQKQKASFSHIAELIRKDERLTAVNGSPTTRAAAIHDGVPVAEVDAYARLLKKLGVNQELTGVQGLGDFCLITSDIVYGPFDTGVIKGYVFSPTNPQPQAKDLDNADAADRNADTAYRQIDGNWYLFELQH